MANHAPNPHTSDLLSAYLAAGGADAEPTRFHDERAPLAYVPGLLPAAIDALALDLGRRVGSNATPAALSCLIAASAAIRGGWQLQAGDANGWKVPPILWGAITGASGTGKSPLIRPATAPLDTIEAGWREHDNKARASWRDASAAHKRAVAKAEKDGTPAPVFDQEQPARRRLLTNDATPEALVPICAENPAGIAFIEDESTKGAGGFDRYASGGGEEQMFNKAWDAAPFSKDRAAEGGTSLYAARLSVSVLLGTQDALLAGAFGGNRSGFLARLLFATATTPDEPPALVASDATAATTWRRVLESLASGAVGQTVMLDPEAAAEFEDYRRHCWKHRLDGARPDSWREHAGKWDTIWLRLALVCWLIENADQVRIDGEIAPVPGAFAKRITRAMREIFEPESARVHLDLLTARAKKAGILDPVAIADWIAERHPAEITLRALRKGAYAFRNAEVAELERALGELASHGWVSPAVRRGKATVWLVNPAVFGATPDHVSVAPTARDRADLHAADQGDPDARMRLTRRGVPVQADDREPMGDGLPEWRGYVSEPDDLTDPDDDPVARNAYYAAMLAECETRGNA